MAHGCQKDSIINLEVTVNNKWTKIQITQ